MGSPVSGTDALEIQVQTGRVRYHVEAGGQGFIHHAYPICSNDISVVFNDIQHKKKVRERVVSPEAETRTNEAEITVLQPTLKRVKVR